MPKLRMSWPLAIPQALRRGENANAMIAGCYAERTRPDQVRRDLQGFSSLAMLFVGNAGRGLRPEPANSQPAWGKCVVRMLMPRGGLESPGGFAAERSF